MPTSPTPTTELEAVNTMLSGIGEAPVNSLSEVTADVSLARHILNETSREVQLEGFQWNVEDNYPLTPDIHGLIKLHPSIVRVHFREPSDRELTIRGNQVYDRINHTFTFPQGTAIFCTVTRVLGIRPISSSLQRRIPSPPTAVMSPLFPTGSSFKVMASPSKVRQS